MSFHRAGLPAHFGVAGVLAFLCILSALPVLAASRDLSTAEWVFVGTVRAKHSFRSQDGRFILTRYLLEVETVVSGEPGAELEIVEFGGEIDGLRMEVSHGVRYQVLGSYLIFATLDERGRVRTASGLSGYSRVLEANDGGRFVVVRSGTPIGQLSGLSGVVSVSQIQKAIRERRGRLPQ